MSPELVGHTKEGWIHSVKGMQGTRSDEISLRSVSVVGDRRVAFIDKNNMGGGSNLLDTTKFPDLLRYRTRFDNPLDPKNSDIVVTAPEGTEYSVFDPLLLERISDESKRNLAILRMGRAAYHSMPVSLMSFGTTREIERLAGMEIDHRAYRQNLYIETTLDVPYEEDGWLGKMIFFGDKPDCAKLIAVKLDDRCSTVNMHPESGEQNPKILKTIVQNHNNTLGIYCAIIGEGKIYANSPVYVASFDIKER